MISYGYAEVRLTSSGIVISSTDPQVLAEIAEELRQGMPNAKIGVLGMFPASRENVLLRIDHLQNHDEAVALWLVRQFCLRGWEPFSGEGGGGRISTVFRLRMMAE